MEKIGRAEPALVDTGIIYALADRNDDWHGRAVGFVSGFRGRLIVPWAVIPEACYLLNAYIGQAAELAFLKTLVDREMSVEQLEGQDLVRTGEIMKRYPGANVGFVDASVAAMAERLKITVLLTTDRRHFSIIKPAHCEGFTLVP
ncbi:MAG: hypothetical protein HW408_1679 [Actinobacteria bacterium]|nr:hypothetical protein [Actinomycetota bacterium]